MSHNVVQIIKNTIERRGKNMLEVNKVLEMMKNYERDNGEFYDEDQLVHFLKSYAKDPVHNLRFNTDILIKDIKSDDDLVYNIMNAEGRDLFSITTICPDYYGITEVIVFSMGLLFASTGSVIIKKAIEYFCKNDFVSPEALSGYIDGKVEDLKENDWKFYEEEVNLLFQIVDAWNSKLETNPFEII